MDSIKIASSGLTAFQHALNTTSHNIANANTEGYSRQRVDLATRPPDFNSGFYRGSGVGVSSVSRISDEFANAQVRDVKSEHSRLEAFSGLASRIDSLVADDQASLTPAMQSFFNSMEQLNTDPSSSTNRVVALSEAQGLTDRFNTQDFQFRSINNDLNKMLETEVNSINSISANLADLNVKINSAAAGNKDNVPSDLLDQRDNLLEEFSEHITINITHYGNGTVGVAAGNGISMVSGNRSFELALEPDNMDSSRMEITWEGKTIGNQVSGGSLGGLTDFRRELLDPTRSELGRLATVFSSKMNEQHQLGIDLNGAAGTDLFKVSQPIVNAASTNTGSGTLSVGITDASDMQQSDYLVSYDGSNYGITRLSDQTSTLVTSGPVNMDGLEISFGGTFNPGDSFLVRPTINGARDIGVNIGNPNQLATAGPVKSEASLLNQGDAIISGPKMLDTSIPGATDTVSIVFTDSTNYQLRDSGSTLLGTGTVGSDGVVSNGAWSVSFSGTPATGDTFTISNNSSGTADNSNGFQMTELQFEKTVGGISTFQEGYSQMVNQVGQSTRQTNVNLSAQNTLLENATAKQLSASGVNLDEEAINLTRYQQAYQAAAQVISTSNTMFNTILGVIGR